MSKYPSDIPSSEPGIVLIIFRCVNDGIDLVDQPINKDIVVTAIEIEVVYTVEATGLLNTYRTNLEDKITSLAVAGSLQCLVNDPLYGISALTRSDSLKVRTFNTGEDCTPQLNNTICSVLQTNIEFRINQSVDASVAAFLAYIEIQENMADSAFVNDIPNLSLIKYNRPLPLLPPIESNESGPKQAVIDAGSTTISSSPWTLGAVVAMCK
jgi:hypothetical protein